MVERELFPEQLRYTDASTMKSSALFEYMHTTQEGLSSEEAERRAGAYGPNRIQTDTTRWYDILLVQCKSSFVYLLLLACVLSFFVGDQIEALMIGVFLCVNIGLGFFQEMRAFHARSSLRKYIVHHVRVRRGGTIKEINAHDVVVGDIVTVIAGDVVPADGIWISASRLEVDESILSGESLPIKKNTKTLPKTPTDYFKASNCGFSQTKVVAGTGSLLVTSIGDATVAGSLFVASRNHHEASEFEKGIQRLSSMLFALVAVTIAVLVVLKIILQHETSTVELIVFGIAMVVGAVPEALPFVTTFSMSRGAIHLAKKGVIIKRLSVIEDLGGVDVFCTDKTGTLTENTLSVAAVWGDKKEVLSWARYSAWDEDVGRFKEGVFDAAIAKGASHTEIASCRHLIIESRIPFDPIARVEQVTINDGGTLVHIIKGVPEILFGSLSEEKRMQAEQWLRAEGQKGRRVLGVALARSVTHTDTPLIGDAECIGMISFEDPLKRGVKTIIAQARDLGVRMIVLSGDAPDVVGYVATKVGLIPKGGAVVTGEAFSHMSAGEQDDLLSHPVAFARVMPLQKLEIIERFKRLGHIVAFLGDGFNDAPGLRLAHVGLAVNNASEMAKDSAPVILTQKDLGTIIDGIKEGRQVFSNTIKYVRATLTSNMGNFYALAFAALLLPWLPLLPVQILLLNLFTDGPMVAIAADRSDSVAGTKPQRYHVRDIIIVALLLGSVSTMFDFAFFGYFVGQGEHVLRTMWFMGSSLTELILLFSIRTLRPFWRAVAPAPILIVLSLFAASLTIVLPYTVIGHEWFGFSTPSNENLTIVLVLAASYFGVTEIAKLLIARFIHEGGKK